MVGADQAGAGRRVPAGTPYRGGRRAARPDGLAADVPPGDLASRPLRLGALAPWLTGVVCGRVPWPDPGRWTSRQPSASARRPSGIPARRPRRALSRPTGRIPRPTPARVKDAGAVLRTGPAGPSLTLPAAVGPVATGRPGAVKSPGRPAATLDSDAPIQVKRRWSGSARRAGIALRRLAGNLIRINELR